MATKAAVKETTKTAAAKNSPEMRDKRAQAIAAMNLVTREGDRFKVGTPGLRNRQQFYEVWRDDNAKVRCTCLEFEETIAGDSAFRCEHILAVKHSLLAKNSEAATKQPAPLKPVVPTAVAESITTDENANEVREIESERIEHKLTEQPVKATAEGRAAVQAAIEARQALKREAAEKPVARELADTKDKEEHTEMKKENLKQPAQFAVVEKQEQEVYESDRELGEQNHSAAQTAQFAQPSNVFPMPFNQTLQALRQRVEPGAIKQREGWRDRNGNVHMVDYIEWHTVADILDRIAPQWSHTIRDIKQIGDSIAVTAAITIDNVTREGIGTGAADTEMGIKKAEHDALKRAAVKFGIARELYRRESDVIEHAGASNNTNGGGGFPSNPIAKSLADLVTPKQLGMIRALGREANVEPDDECQTVMSCKTDELSKKAASAFIQHLQEKQGQAEQAPQVAASNHNGLRRVG